MKKSGIYQIRNTQNGKVYIGQTRDLKFRIYEHIRVLRRGEHHNRYLQRAFDKYGESAFEFSILEECPIEELDAKEKEWIKRLRSMDAAKGYNLESGGNVGKEISESVRLQKIGPNNPMYGAKLSESHIEALRIKNRGLNSALTESDVEDIKLKILSGTPMREIADLYGLTAAAIGKIKTGKNWGYVREDLNPKLLEMAKRQKEDRDRQIHEMNAAGISRAKIAKQVGCTPTTVARVIGHKSEYFRDSSKKSALISQIVSDFRAGMDKAAIMEKHHINSTFYVKVTHDAYNEMKQNIKRQAIKMRESGMMVKDIAKALGVARTTITRWTLESREHRDNHKD